MNWIKRMIAKCFIWSTGFTYTNLARMFMRLFVGIMLMQFGIRHLVRYDVLRETFPAVIGMSNETSLILMIMIEVICSLFLMVGFLTRLSAIPPAVAMIFAEYYILHDMVPDTIVYSLDSTDPGYLPIMFIGIYFYILLAGPGRISLDYFISLFFIRERGRNEEEELTDV